MTPPIVAIIHAQFLTTREENLKVLNDKFVACGNEVVIIAGPEPPIDNPSLLSSICVIDNNLGPPNISSIFTPMSRHLSIRELSNALKHATALQYIASREEQTNDEESWHFVLEDDVLIDDVNALMVICKNAPKDADILMFGVVTDQTPPQIGQVRFDKLSRPFILSNCDCYAVRMRSAKVLANSIIPIRFCMNVHLSWVMCNSSMNVYLTSPNFSIDGTKLGAFVGSINGDNPLTLNQHYMRLASDPKLDIETFLDIHRQMMFKKHPEVRLLMARKLDLVGRHAEAIREYAITMGIIESHNGVLGQSSNFMRAYLDSHKYHQEETMGNSKSLPA